MNERDRLIELIDEAINDEETSYSNIADYLLANGVIVLPCKVGAKVWFIKKDRVPDDDYRMNFHCEWVMGYVHFQLSMIEKIGKTMFLTREEAEQELQRRAHIDS